MNTVIKFIFSVLGAFFIGAATLLVWPAILGLALLKFADDEYDSGLAYTGVVFTGCTMAVVGSALWFWWFVDTVGNLLNAYLF